MSVLKKGADMESLEFYKTRVSELAGRCNVANSELAVLRAENRKLKKINNLLFLVVGLPALSGLGYQLSAFFS